MLHLLQYYMEKNDEENQIKVLSRCIAHALSVKELNPTLTELSMSSVLEVILGQDIDD